MTKEKPKLETPRSFSCTLVVQSSADRIGFVSILLERWKGRVALAVLYPLNTSRETIMDSIRGLPQRVAIINVIHKGGEYPVNILRNMAIKLVNTTHFLLVDVDMVPSEDLEELILHETMSTWLANPKMALVVPAFEHRVEAPCLSVAECLSSTPTNFQQLTTCIHRAQCQPFQHVFSNATSQSSTDTPHWLRLNPTQRTYPILCFQSLRYEPFVVLPNSPSTPGFFERFVGYGKNRAQHLTHLRFLGFDFRVLGKGFLFHQAHEATEAKITWTNPESGLTKRMTSLFQEFKLSLERKFVAPYIPLCANMDREVKEEGDEPGPE